MIVHQSSFTEPGFAQLAMARAKRPCPDSQEPERVLAKTRAELEFPCWVETLRSPEPLWGDRAGSAPARIRALDIPERGRWEPPAGAKGDLRTDNRMVIPET
ncbi:MAG: hypothetical protein EBY21_01760 [Alphaproteobacteria bacterium]|nr:hypothetical protein [Alphaproteobacteria bacterium]